MRSSAGALISMFESEPTPKRPSLAKNSTPLKMPSPSEASVSGHSPATAPDFAKRCVVARHVRGVDQAPARIETDIVE